MPQRRVNAALLSALLSVLVTVGLTAGASPAAAALAAPGGLSPDSTTVAGNPVLAWNPVAGATSYAVQVSSSSTYATSAWSTTTVNTQSVPTAALPSGTLYWRVKATASGTESPWASASFTRNAMAAPAPLSPADNATLPQPQSPPQLTWSAVNGATSYEVEVGLDPGFVGAESYTTKTTSISAARPHSPNEWFWRVRGVLSGGQATNWSAQRSYTVGGLAQPTVVSPANSPQSVVNDVVLEWSSVPGAEEYEFRISTDRNFNDDVITGKTAATRWSPEETLNNDQYWWQVRAYDTAGQTAAWASFGEDRIWQFRRAWQVTGQPQSAPPTLLHPANQVSPVTSDPFFYQWKPVRLASEYELQVGPDANFSPDTFQVCVTQATTLTPSLERDTSRCAPQPGHTYFWRVRAIDGPADVLSSFSPIFKYTYNPGQVTQLSPAPGASVDVPTMSWQPMLGAEMYRVTITQGADEDDFTTYSTSFTPTKEIDPSDGAVTWRVQAIYATGAATVLPLSGRTFTLTGAAQPSAAAPDPVAPADGAHSARFPALRWKAVEGAAYYRLLVGAAGTGVFTSPATRFEYPAGTDLNMTYLRPGDYDWAVQAYTSQGASLGIGATRSFVIDELDAVAGEGVALTGLALNADATRCDDALSDVTGDKTCAKLEQTPVLDWEPVPQASSYMVYLARDRELTNMVIDPEDIETSNTRWTPPAELLPDSQAGQAYYWVVRPCLTEGVCAPDPTEATHTFAKLSNPVQPVSPANGSSVADQVTFDWTDYLATNTTSPTLTTGVPATVEAAFYRLQVSRTASFQQVLETVTVDQTSYTSPESYPSGPLFWRVAAVDASNNLLTWSPVSSLVKTSTAPTLGAPANMSITAQTPALRWSAQAYASRYEVEIYRNNDTNFSEANRVLEDDTELNAYSLTTPLPASPLPYVWRVRRLDVAGDPGSWSTARKFIVRGAPTVLTSPAAGINVSATRGLFTWQTVQGAAGYLFERRAVGAASVTETVSTVALAHAPRSRISDGTWEWRVTTLDAAGKPVASSAWRGFVVDGTAPEVVANSPTDTARPTVNVRATFSEKVTRVNTGTMRLYRVGSQHPLAVKVTLSTDKKTATLNPTALLQRGKTYRVVLANGITDRAGNPLVTTKWTFTIR